MEPLKSTKRERRPNSALHLGLLLRLVSGAANDVRFRNKTLIFTLVNEAFSLISTHFVAKV